MVDQALLFRSASELAALIRQGVVSSLQVVAAHLEQIRRWNPQLHAVVTLREEAALRDAAAADRQVQEGAPLGPLHGVPMTLKDTLRVRGVRSTYGGLPPYLRHVAKSDCKLAARLRAAGAIVTGRTNVPLMALDWQCNNPFFDEGLNPWDLTRTPGGSSGGAAAAVAAGMTPLELGSDLGGSIRYPAHCCGVLGLRTSDGLLPIDDIGPEDMPTAFKRLVSLGPIARTVGDLALMLDVLHAQPAAQDPLPEKLRVLVTTAWPDTKASPATVALLEKVAHGLRADGHDVEFGGFRDIDVQTAWRVWGTIAGYELWSATPPPFRNRPSRFLFQSYMLRYKLGEGPFAKWFSHGMAARRDEYEAALAQREEILKTVDSFFNRYTLWLLPVAMGEAIHTQHRGAPIYVDGTAIPYSAYLGAYTVPTTILGTPVLTMPVGKSPSGMPIGIQVHGARFADRRLLDIAERFLAKYITVEVPPLLR